MGEIVQWEITELLIVQGAIIQGEIVLFPVKKLIKQAKEKFIRRKTVKVSEKCIRIMDIFKNVMIKNKKIDEKVDAHEKQFRYKYTQLMN